MNDQLFGTIYFFGGLAISLVGLLVLVTHQMTKHTDTSRSTDSDSSAPNSGLSGQQAEERTAREGR